MMDTQPEVTVGLNPSEPHPRPWRRFWAPALFMALIVVLFLLYLRTPTTTMLISSGDPGDLYYLVGAVLDDILEDAFPGFPDGRDVDFTNLRSRGAVSR